MPKLRNKRGERTADVQSPWGKLMSSDGVGNVPPNVTLKDAKAVERID